MINNVYCTSSVTWFVLWEASLQEGGPGGGGFLRFSACSGFGVFVIQVANDIFPGCFEIDG